MAGRFLFKRAALSLIAAALSIGLLACSATTSPSDEPVTISLWHVYGSQTESPLNDLVAEFNATIGAEEGIVVNVTSVTDSDSIDEALAAAANDEPGSAALPDLFTAYPRVLDIVGFERLLAWDEYLSPEELEAYVDGFVAEGYFGGALLMLPIAKSTEMLFLNETLFDRFAAEAGADVEDLASFETLLPLCERYADWSDGQALFQVNDYYHYFLAVASAQGESLVRDGKLDLEDAWFEDAWLPLARAGISGGLVVGEGYASDRWKTGEVLCNVGSTAGILYLRDYVTYADGSTEDIDTAVLPYPAFDDGATVVIQRGCGLFAMESDDARENQAMATFARWITLGESNAAFATSAGYLPVTEDAFDHLMANTQGLDEPKYRMLYETAAEYTEYAFCTAPVFEGAGDMQDGFESAVKAVLLDARAEYASLLATGMGRQAAMRQAAEASLEALRQTL
ncbi:MAG: extracellular solute-binding protein [Eggerthellaceae bacterium]|nr:extracellular solute-binding protein [Eggerthellaceae bacterium]